MWLVTYVYESNVVEDKKEQPTSPVNNEIPILLEDVAHSTEPWLMFM